MDDPSFSEEELIKLNAVSDKIILFMTFYSVYFLKFERRYKYTGLVVDIFNDAKMSIIVHVPEKEQRDIRTILPRFIDNVEITVDWIDKIRYENEYYRKTPKEHNRLPPSFQISKFLPSPSQSPSPSPSPSPL